jgi:deoxyadenosine/deoxycytidine kinase
MTSPQVNDVSGPEQPTYVVVEGPIGVGKTSLARRLAASFGYETLLEDPGANPFLERFYSDPRRHALATQLYFLFQRVRQLEPLRQGDLFHPPRVADFIVEKDMLFAEVTLDPDEMHLYEQVYARLSPSVPAPDLVIYLQAPADILLDRIRRRGVAFEQTIDREYLEKLCDAYARFFFSYSGAPLLMVNAAHINLVDGDRDYDALLEYLAGIKTGRHFLNPLSDSG